MLDDVKNADVPEIGALDFPALSTLRDRIEEKIREMREVGGPALKEQFAEMAAAIGMTPEEVVQLGGKRRGRPPKDREEV
jgi:hypothetical protein